MLCISFDRAAKGQVLNRAELSNMSSGWVGFKRQTSMALATLGIHVYPFVTTQNLYLSISTAGHLKKMLIAHKQSVK